MHSLESQAVHLDVAHSVQLLDVVSEDVVLTSSETAAEQT